MLVCISATRTLLHGHGVVNFPAVNVGLAADERRFCAVVGGRDAKVTGTAPDAIENESGALIWLFGSRLSLGVLSR